MTGSERNFEQVIEGWRKARYGECCCDRRAVECADEASVLRNRLVGLVREWRNAKFDHPSPCFCNTCFRASIYHGHADALAQLIGQVGPLEGE